VVPGLNHPEVGFTLDEGFGDLHVNGGFVDWGAFNPNHTYSLTTSFASTVLNLGVFDGDPSANTKNTGWYADNSGSLNYAISYVGP
jgi:hypothetical protein